MSEFYEVFALFYSNPTLESLSTFVSEMEKFMTMEKEDDIKRWLLEALSDIRAKDRFKHIRGEEDLLRLYSLLGSVSQNMGSIGIYEQLQKDGLFADSYKFHLKYAEEVAMTHDMLAFNDVLVLTRSRFKNSKRISEIDEEFRVLAQEHFKDPFDHLFKSQDDTFGLFAPPIRETCQICGRATNIANHFGGRCCETCMKFYKRTVKLYHEITCEKGGQCEITASNWRNCRKCRLDKCFNSGMRMPAAIVDQEPTRQRSTSSGTGGEVTKDGDEKNDEGEDDGGEKEHVEDIEGLKQESSWFQDSVENQRSSTNTHDFDYSVVNGSIKTSTPSKDGHFVGVEAYFGNVNHIETKNEKELVFPSAPTTYLRKLMNRVPWATKFIRKPSNEPIMKQIGEGTEEGVGTSESTGKKAEKAPYAPINHKTRRNNNADINPWDANVRRDLMRLADQPTNIQRFHNIDLLALNTVDVGGEKFMIQTLIRNGSYSRVYRAISQEKKVVSVSVAQTMSCEWDVYICYQMRSRFLRNNKENSKKIAATCIMSVLDAHIFKNASFIVTEYYGYGTLLEYANNLKDPNWHLSCFLINQAATIVKEVHDVGIIHANIKPSSFVITRTIDANWTKDQLVTVNCFLLKLVDWGKAIDMESWKGVEFVGRMGMERLDCPEMLDGRPWTFQVDFFGFAATVAMLLTGKDATLTGKALGHYSLKTEIKRRNELREIVFQMVDSFLNVRSCSELPGWNTTIDALSARWNDKFEKVVWMQCVDQFNKHCMAIRK